MAKLYDVVIAGGGVSGCAAAVAAARCGAEVLLIERYGFLGGSLTNAGVGPMMSFHSGKKQVVGGIAQEIVDELVRRGGAIGHIEDTTGYVQTVTPFDPEMLKCVLDDMLRDAHCNVRFHSYICGAEVRENICHSIRVASRDGITSFEARVFVDATGDGDLAARTGAIIEQGRPEDSMCQPMTMNMRICNVNRERLIQEIYNEPDNFNIRDLSSIQRAGRLSFAGFYRQFTRAKKEGRISTQREDVLMFESIQPGCFVVNTTRIIRPSPTDPVDLSEAETEGRRQAQEIMEFLRNEAPGFENAVLMSTGVQIGVRESRRIVGEYMLTEQDLLESRDFEDTVALGGYPIDIHNPNGSGTMTMRLPEGAWYRIPLRSLISAKPQNLFMCGRCISVTHQAEAAIRVTPIAMATGQAAGVAAAVCAERNGIAADTSFQDVRSILLQTGAILY